MWKEYQLVIKFKDKLMGGIPKHPDIIRSWLEARMPSEAAFQKLENPVPLPELAEQVAEQVAAAAIAENKVWSGFKSDARGLYVGGYHLKAHLKDCANILQGYLGIKALKAKLSDRVLVIEDGLYLGKTAPDGFWEHPVHVLGPAGPRSALKRTDYVEGVTLTATLRVLNDGVITLKTLTTILEYGSLKGFGPERGLGHGRYSWELEEKTDG